MTQRLEAGTAAPLFTLDDHSGAPVSLADFAGHKVIVYFYPEAMTPGCTTQACDFRDSLNSLAAAGYRVIGISRDEPEKLATFAQHEGLNFSLLSDSDHSVHSAYGAWGEKNLYGTTVTGALRSTFVIDESGVITLALYNVKATGHVGLLRKRLGIDAT
ncbi:MAG: thioredoxin-dependent thiol peroxidase [Rhodoglobus sp.]